MADRTDNDFTLTTFSTSWKEYQDRLSAAVAPLSAGQLALRAAPALRSAGEIALHIVGCRMFWLTEFIGEDGGEELNAFARWNKVALGGPYASWDEVGRALGETVPPTASELARGLDQTWLFMANCQRRWGPDGLRQTVPYEDDAGAPGEVSRAWVVWHVLEHDLHHGGELSLTLGMHGIAAEFAV